ncbi:MAG: WxcM-like domain-containing protein [Marinobacter adhaerens]|uniref:WxcM-like domain-containing protein n=1 Tax=Marinobacter adhaerens TaxID=1033846 RepID=A0A844I4K0_9GAMM|nr:WxcM-like domain-containing protein [Marinobacter adhaerens]
MSDATGGLVRWVELPSLGDERGELVAIEAGKSVPFPIKRVYYMFGCGVSVSRGYHAHRALQQVAICVAGSCIIRLDDGREKADVILDSPHRGLLIGGMVWREMHEFSPDCVLLVLADQHYDELDYIRSYDEFLEVLNAKN